MTQFDPQLDHLLANQLANQRDRADATESKVIGSASEHAPTRRLGTSEVCTIVLAIIVIHWLCMQWLANWLGGENSFTHGQSSTSANHANSVSIVDDGWRRTANGWEYLPAESTAMKTPRIMPTVHVSPTHIWPAAAAACMLLVIVGLPDKRMPR